MLESTLDFEQILNGTMKLKLIRNDERAQSMYFAIDLDVAYLVPQH